MKLFKKITTIVAVALLGFTACIGLFSDNTVSNGVLAADGTETSYSFASSIPSGWTPSPAQSGFETSGSLRGAQWSRKGASGTKVVLTYTPSVAVKKVVITSSTNYATENATSLDVKIGDVALGSAQYLTKTSTNVQYTFEGQALTGTISITATFVITSNDSNAKSFYIKSIVATEGSTNPAIAITGDSEIVAGHSSSYTSVPSSGVTWSLENVSPAGCATISGNTVTGVSSGNATLKAVASSYANTTKALTIVEPSVQLNESSIKFAPNGSAKTLTASALHFTPTSYSWSKVDENSVISLSSTSGSSIEVTPSSNDGVSVVTVSATDGTITKTASCSVAVESGSSYVLTSNTTNYNVNPLTPTSFHTYVNNSSVLTIGSTITNIRLGASPETTSIMIGSNGNTGDLTISAPSGEIITTVIVNMKLDSNNNGILALNGYSHTPTDAYANYNYTVCSSTVVFAATNRVWAASITINTSTSASVATLAYGTFFLEATSTECSNLALTASTWTAISNVYDNSDSAVKALIASAVAGDSNDLTKAVQRYDFIIAKYLAYADFMGRNPLSGVRQNQFFGSDNHSAIIIFISAIVLSTISIAFVVIQKKKKFD